MSANDKRRKMRIDGREYTQIRHDNQNDTNWMNVPVLEEGVVGSGLHIVDKKREKTHWDKFEGKNKLKEKESIRGDLPITNLILDTKQNTIFIAPPHNPVLVLRGSSEKEEHISFEHYEKNKENYIVKLKDREGRPRVVGLKK